MRTGRRQSRGFTLVELLIAVAIIGVLLALLLPSLGAVRAEALNVQCKSNLRVLGAGVLTYVGSNRMMFPPVANWQVEPARYWWGTNAEKPDFSNGILTPYLGHEAGAEDGLFECPMQPWGSYESQGNSNGPTTTYGYNGYYLCPAGTPGWAATIGRRPGRSRSSIPEPGQVFMFADTLMSWGDGRVTNNCLLDPPWTWSRRRWQPNANTTVCYRHSGRANIFFVDGHADAVEPTKLVDPVHMIGYTGDSNAPHYVPDYQDWK
jgi:prepilin-type N-terminal cleavage/methylation domain-containing protein/prepilin-type processing-associated H-X9-DG protein